ncbi:hypothetical protein L486_07941 [Kwoniella mangroviensis CBS 10435]|uniref:Kinase n=1 Tax=Kwoniella mangroviensis CBS 10435 TaxID=1331196 RepID=A0A1B9IFR0_9TREE|nr:hypothetical protein L486_07941 [Kwoniella mangroviensis CBS 10435]
MAPSLTLTDRTPLANQVAGHDGVMSDASGSLVIKPALAREIAFYQTLNSSGREDPIRRLKLFVPKFLGTLRLEGQLSSGGDVERLEGKDEVPESVVLENLSYAFTHPSILDVKLGTVLYDPDASEEKKQRMDKQARETTTHELGIRFTGCTTWHSPSQSYIVTPKSFGKTITAEELPEGLVRFFPTSSDRNKSLVQTTTDKSASAPTTISADPSTGVPPTPITASNSSSAPAEVQTFKDHSIPSTSLVKVLEIIIEEIDRLVSVLENLEIRFVGGSLLIVYEGDPSKLEEALDRYQLNKLKSTTEEGVDKDRSAFSDDGSIPSDLDSDEESDEDDEEEDEESRASRRCPPVRVKLIDFAHTWLAQGEGPDEGVLKGLSTLRGLLQGRQKEIEGGI